uniref:Uncharacterized protein n=1 Tax=Arundo donax TaxID=35708 RepID=A0A0A9HCU5_ARUDO
MRRRGLSRGIACGAGRRGKRGRIRRGRRC